MVSDRFDALFAALTTAPSRRAVVQLLGGVGLARLLGPTQARAEHKCAKAGQRTSHKRKKYCSGLVKDASRRCVKRCVPGHCPANQICLRSGLCQRCTVICPAGDTTCGAALETTMAGGGTVYVCPGTYQKPSSSFQVGKSVTVIGAGDGIDPARNTILQVNGSQGVVRITSTTVISATFQNLRITGGGGGPGGGIYNGPGNILSLIGCTITGNKAESTSGAGGVIFNSEGARLSVTNCTITDNSGENTGGGIKNFAGRVSLRNTTVTGNTAIGSTGGGIDTDGGTVTLDAASRVTGNGARPSDPDSGGGIFNSSEFNGGGIVTLARTANVTGNTPDNCGGEAVPRCVD